MARKPKPTKEPDFSGFNLVDAGVHTIADAAGLPYKAYVSHFVCEECLETVASHPVDVRLAARSGNPALFRYVEDGKFAQTARENHACRAKLDGDGRVRRAVETL